MQWAKSEIATAPDGAVFLADELEAAQGRQGRTWGIRPGQLLVTIVLKPEILSSFSQDDLSIRLNQLNMALTLGILEPIKAYGAGLKWPNDFVINDKKVCGMLVQLVWHDQKPVGIVFGFGLNVNTVFEKDDELFSIAGSLISARHAPSTPFVPMEPEGRMEGTAVLSTNQQTIDMRTLYKQLLTSLDHFYTLWKQQQFSHIYKEWKDHQVYLGKPLTIHQKDGSIISGIMNQVMPNGDLMLKTGAKIISIPFYTVEEVKTS